MIFNGEVEGFIDFGRYPKAKYNLQVDGRVLYSFVTTIRSQENAIEELYKVIEIHRTDCTRGFKIYKVVDGWEEKIHEGKIPPILTKLKMRV